MATIDSRIWPPTATRRALRRNASSSGMEDIEEEGDGGRKPARRAREEVRRARCEKQNLEPPLPHNVKKVDLTISDAVNRQLLSADQAQDMARALVASTPEGFAADLVQIAPGRTVFTLEQLSQMQTVAFSTYPRP